MKLVLKGHGRLPMVLLKFAVFTFITAIILKLTAIGYNFINRYDRNTSLYQIETVASKIKNMDYIDDGTKNEITQMLDEFNKQNINGLYYIDITRDRQSYVHFKYKKDAPENFFSRAYEGENGWLISYNISEAQANNDFKKQKDAQRNMANSLPNKLGLISNYLFILSTALLSASLILTAYDRKTFNNQ